MNKYTKKFYENFSLENFKTIIFTVPWGNPELTEQKEFKRPILKEIEDKNNNIWYILGNGTDYYIRKESNSYYFGSWTNRFDEKPATILSIK